MLCSQVERGGRKRGKCPSSPPVAVEDIILRVTHETRDTAYAPKFYACFESHLRTVLGCARDEDAVRGVCASNTSTGTGAFPGHRANDRLSAGGRTGRTVGRK